MRLGVSHVCLSVSDLDRARSLYVDAVGWSVVGDGPGALDLDAGGVTVRLLATGDGSRRRAARRHSCRRPILRLQTTHVGAAVESLVAAGGELIRPPAHHKLERVAEVADADGNRLVVWRALRESELGFIPELPTTRGWSLAAEELMQSLLARVPEQFRDLARGNAVSEAELLAGDAGEVEIGHVVRAYIRATPRMMRHRVRQPLVDHGLQPDDYSVDFAC